MTHLVALVMILAPYRAAMLEVAGVTLVAVALALVSLPLAIGLVGVWLVAAGNLRGG